MLYFQIQDPGIKDWITHEDNEYSHISGYPGDVWVTELNQAWGDRVGASSLEYQEAQAIVDEQILIAQNNWVSGSSQIYPQPIILPQ
jgi:hypothetical protein